MDTKAILQKQLESFNAHNAEAFVSAYTSDATCYDPYYEQALKGHKELLQDLSDFFNGFPDLKGKIVGNILISDNLAALEAEMSGTHTGYLPSPNGPIPPTKRKIHISMSRFVEFTKDGLIKKESRYYDIMSIMVQLGLMQENA
jgi:steroid delta-isomerase-like uncharacterized protein